jgi:glycosyltransferase involved in cell wall biosynthesis
MDGDLQHPPETIPELVAAWRDGNDIVYGVMTERQGETALKGLTARAFYRLFSWLASIDSPAAAGDFRLVNRKALAAFLAWQMGSAATSFASWHQAYLDRRAAIVALARISSPGERLALLAPRSISFSPQIASFAAI